MREGDGIWLGYDHTFQPNHGKMPPQLQHLRGRDKGVLDDVTYTNPLPVPHIINEVSLDILVCEKEFTSLLPLQTRQFRCMEIRLPNFILAHMNGRTAIMVPA